MPNQDRPGKSTTPPARKPQPRPRPSRQTEHADPPSPLSRASRSQIVLIVVSSLVVCSLILAGVVAIATDQLGRGGDSTQAPYTDPNKDVIAEQQTKVAQNPDDYYALTLLANLLGNTGRLTEAIPLYEKALQMRPDDQGVRLDFARALADGGHRSDAEIQFRKLIADDPNNQQAHYYLAEMYRVSAPPRTDEAIAEYQKAVAIDPTTYMAQQATEQLKILGITASPVASPSSSTPAANASPQG
ncbi:MAG: tetratricopeptide repeat protein [Thermomicrobiales bacterium]